LEKQKGEFMKNTTFLSITVKTILVHTVTYFIVGLIFSTLLDYSAKFSDPAISIMMRPTSDPLVASGAWFQVLRGFLFGLAFYFLREIVFARKNGWMILWLVLVTVGILSPFGAAPSSIEGMVYTRLPIWFHFVGLPEILIQALVLAYLTYYWVNHPEKKWLAWVFGIAFALVLLMSTLGVLAGLGILQVPE
jgi:hypothetical protein